MSDSDYVSILIPLENCHDHLNDTILSVLRQTHEHWEIIIGIYDCVIESKVEKQVASITGKYNKFQFRIRTIVYNTTSIPQTLNSMIIDATYNIVAIMNSGDIWVANKLEKQIPYISTYDVVGSRSEYFGDTTGYPHVPVGDLQNTNFLIANPIIQGTMIIRKDLCKWDDIVLYNYDLMLKLKHMKKKHFNIQDVLCKCRVHSASQYDFNITNDLKAKWMRTFAIHD
jgi:hypothetical protein